MGWQTFMRPLPSRHASRASPTAIVGHPATFPPVCPVGVGASLGVEAAPLSVLDAIGAVRPIKTAQSADAAASTSVQVVEGARTSPTKPESRYLLLRENAGGRRGWNNGGALILNLCTVVCGVGDSPARTQAGFSRSIRTMNIVCWHDGPGPESRQYNPHKASSVAFCLGGSSKEDNVVLHIPGMTTLAHFAT